MNCAGRLRELSLSDSLRDASLEIQPQVVVRHLEPLERFRRQYVPLFARLPSEIWIELSIIFLFVLVFAFRSFRILSRVASALGLHEHLIERWSGVKALILGATLKLRFV